MFSCGGFSAENFHRNEKNYKILMMVFALVFSVLNDFPRAENWRENEILQNESNLAAVRQRACVVYTSFDALCETFKRRIS